MNKSNSSGGRICHHHHRTHQQFHLKHNRTNNNNNRKLLLVFGLIQLFMATFIIDQCESRSFSLLGCLGEYNLSKFAELDRICEECFLLYHEPQLNLSCRKDCFRNDVFVNCVDALKLSHEKEKLLGYVDQIFG